jgi:hypothetical protein
MGLPIDQKNSPGYIWCENQQPDSGSYFAVLRKDLSAEACDGYESAPSVIDLATIAFAHYVYKGERLFDSVCLTREKYEEEIGIKCPTYEYYPILIGSFGDEGLKIHWDSTQKFVHANVRRFDCLPEEKSIK